MDAALRAVSAGIADRYEIERELGSGGTAVVYLARDLRHDRHVAIKVLRPDISASVSGERFLREVRVAARLAHAHIVGLIDSGRVATETGGDLLYYVMPFVHGESLRDRLRREGQLPVTDALRIASEVADALAFAHAHGVIHRDIKPENILLSGATPAGASTAHAQVADFGIARLLGDSDAALTATGVSIGTPPYMSPEQASGDRTITERTDIYSLGCVLYEMLVGEPPFTGPNASAIFARHLSAPMPGIRTVRPGVPDEVEALVRSALEKVPADRIGDAATLKSRLDEARERSSYERRSAGTPGRAANGRARAFAIAATLVAATLGGYLVVSRAQRTGAAVVPTVPAGDAKRLDPSKIAVMPFKLNGDTARAYVADASTDELISALSRVGGLRVVARSSVQSGVAGGRSPVETARELSAGSLIEGTITEHDASITYEVAVVDVNTGEHAWSKRYERRGSDMAGLQDSVARAVAARLLSRESLGSPDVATRVSGPAHDAYLHGVYFARRAWQRPDSRAIEDSAIRYFQRALAIDPAYAVAHASIAEMYTRRFFNYDPNPEWEQRAFSEIEKALAIDPNLPEAYQAKGNLTWTRANAFPHEAAAKLHRRATALKPSFVEPHQSLGSLYMHIGLLDSALAEFATALDLDPATPLVPPRIARVHWYQGKYDVALRELEAIDKPLVSFAAERALILNYLGRSSEALSYLNGLQGSSEESYDFAAARAVIHASRGERALALSAIARALQGGEKASHFHHAEYSIAEAYALLGDKDRALEFLRKTAEDGMPCYPLFQRDPHLRSLADDPRFKQFMTDLKDRWERLGQVLFQPSNKLP